MSRGFRIALTGGPGGGKSTAADLFRRELRDEVILVPEAATMLFSGGFPRYREASAVRAAQRAIFFLQRGLEDTQSAAFPGRILLCDRGTVDGAAYWPDAPEGFFAAMGTTLEDELDRYDAVIFFESAAVGDHEIDSGNAARIETVPEAAALDGKLRELWSRHPKFSFVPNNRSFLHKITQGLEELQRNVNELRQIGGSHVRRQT